MFYLTILLIAVLQQPTLQIQWNFKLSDCQKKLESKRVVDVITCPVSRQHKWHSLNSQQSITRRQTILSKEAYPFIRVRIAVSSSTW